MNRFKIQRYIHVADFAQSGSHTLHMWRSLGLMVLLEDTWTCKQQESWIKPPTLQFMTRSATITPPAAVTQ